MEEETKKSMVFLILVIGMMLLTSWFASVDAKLYWLLHYIWKIYAHLLWFGVWQNSGMFNSFDGSAELDKHWTGHADGYEGYTACDWALLCLPVVMDQLPEVYLGSASDQRRAEAWRCSNLPDVVYWIFFWTLWVTLWEIIMKLLV